VILDTFKTCSSEHYEVATTTVEDEGLIYMLGVGTRGHSQVHDSAHRKMYMDGHHEALRIERSTPNSEVLPSLIIFQSTTRKPLFLVARPLIHRRVSSCRVRVYGGITAQTRDGEQQMARRII
jgi:hypothetical protein